MPVYDSVILEEAMNAIKEEMFDDLSESLLRDQQISDYPIESVKKIYV